MCIKLAILYTKYTGGRQNDFNVYAWVLRDGLGGVQEQLQLQHQHESALGAAVHANGGIGAKPVHSQVSLVCSGGGGKPQDVIAMTCVAAFPLARGPFLFLVLVLVLSMIFFQL